MIELIYCKIENEKIYFEAVGENHAEIVSYLVNTYDIHNVLIDIIESEICFNFKSETAKYYGTLKQITKL